MSRYTSNIRYRRRYRVKARSLAKAFRSGERVLDFQSRKLTSLVTITLQPHQLIQYGAIIRAAKRRVVSVSPVLTSCKGEAFSMMILVLYF